jgi:hypothetical protein
MLAHNLKAEKHDIADQLELKIKAIVQQYNNRLISNDLTVQ